MEKERIKKLLELDKNFASNCVVALKDLKGRIASRLKDNQVINIRIARELADTTKQLWKEEYCYIDYKGLGLSIKATSNISLNFYLNNKKETISISEYSCAYCKNRALDLDYVMVIKWVITVMKTQTQD